MNTSDGFDLHYVEDELVFVCSSMWAETRTTTLYKVDGSLARDDVMQASQCECGAGPTRKACQPQRHKQHVHLTYTNIRACRRGESGETVRIGYSRMCTVRL